MTWLKNGQSPLSPGPARRPPNPLTELAFLRFSGGVPDRSDAGLSSALPGPCPVRIHTGLWVGAVFRTDPRAAGSRPPQRGCHAAVCVAAALTGRTVRDLLSQSNGPPTKAPGRAVADLGPGQGRRGGRSAIPGLPYVVWAFAGISESWAEVVSENPTSCLLQFASFA